MRLKLTTSMLILTVYLFCYQKASGQSLPLGTPLMEDTYRRAQLLGNIDLRASFTSRPFCPYISARDGYLLNNSEIQSELSSSFHLNSTKMANDKAVIKILPLTWKQQYNSDHPEGINDGTLIPARGYQTMISGGIFAKYSFLSIQLMPELVMAENKAFQGFSDEHPDDVWKVYYKSFLRSIDIPERFGEEKYLKTSWGQSSIRLTFGPISFGLSNENLWWGPGMKNALLMTNNAPGFKHLTFNTVKPVKTIIGSFEGQLIAGRLEASGFPNIDTLRLLQHNVKFTSKPDDWRYINGIVLSYQPRWLPGLFLGATRSFITYHKNLRNKINDYLPVITPMLKKSVGNEAEDSIQRDQLASVFMRWVAPESHMEVYFEYGREDHSYDLTDLLLEPDHSAAFIIGARKLVPIKNRTDEYIDIQIEITQLEKRLSSAQRAQGSWYLHNQVLDGYTQNGQYLGAGIGSGSNMQYFSISWVNKLKRLGFEFKRVVHNDDFWALAIKDYRKHWVDIGGSLIGEWNFKNILLNACIETVGSINYQWLYDPIPSDPPLWWDHGKVRYNVHAELGVTYCF